MYQLAVQSTASRCASDYHFRLLFHGFHKENDNKYIISVRTKRQVEHVRKLCSKYHLRFSYNNAFSDRSSTYRQTFFTNARPVLSLFGGIYYCAYCGRLMTKKRTTVDHLYPVGAVSQDLRLQKKLQNRGITDINQAENLVAACDHCNKSKGKKLGVWILKGRLGRHNLYWTIRWALRLALLAVFVAAIYLWVNDPSKFRAVARPVIQRIIGWLSAILQNIWRLFLHGKSRI